MYSMDLTIILIFFSTNPLFASLRNDVSTVCKYVNYWLLSRPIDFIIELLNNYDRFSIFKLVYGLFYKAICRYLIFSGSR